MSCLAVERVRKVLDYATTSGPTTNVIAHSQGARISTRAFWVLLP
jgi:hypothetical protein